MRKRWPWLLGICLTAVAATLLVLKLTERQGPFDFLDGLEPVIARLPAPEPSGEPVSDSYWYTVDRDYDSVVAEAKAELLPKGWKFVDNGDKCEFLKYFYHFYQTAGGSGSVSTHEKVAFSNGYRLIGGESPDIVKRPGSVAIFIYLYNRPLPDSLWQRFVKLMGF